jgi:hypothetical protein
MTSPESTISEEYRAQQKALHENPAYGMASVAFAPAIKELMPRLGTRSISDYGAGKKRLLSALNDLGVTDFAYFPYDPAFPEYGKPMPADLVCCIDVLEHVEPDCLAKVLLELRGLVLKYGFFSVHTGAAMKTLPDGRNAHLIQKPSSWWLPRLCEHFEILHLKSAGGGFWVIVTPKSDGT